ncbi:MAG: hypothetical protein ACI8PT_000848, partial [Gammaproteobacteria bacterium]
MIVYHSLLMSGSARSGDEAASACVCK